MIVKEKREDTYVMSNRTYYENMKISDLMTSTLTRVNELSELLKLDSDEKLKLDEQDSINLNSTFIAPKALMEIPTKSYVISLHEDSRNIRDLSLVFNDHDKEIDNIKSSLSDSITVTRNSCSDNEVSNKKRLMTQ